MSIWGAVAGGFAGTLVLTTALRTASELQLTRIDIPFLLGTAFTTDQLRGTSETLGCWRGVGTWSWRPRPTAGRAWSDC